MGKEEAGMRVSKGGDEEEAKKWDEELKRTREYDGMWCVMLEKKTRKGRVRRLTETVEEEEEDWMWW